MRELERVGAAAGTAVAAAARVVPAAVARAAAPAVPAAPASSPRRLMRAGVVSMVAPLGG
ncbi:hypothetical protein ACFQ0M_24020 [Kitasatospora aburaviensis]